MLFRSGIQSPADVARRMRGDKNQSPKNVQASGDALGDNQLANNLRQQAAKMAAEAKGLLAESERLLKEAASMDPTPVVAEAAPAPKARKTRAKVNA